MLIIDNVCKSYKSSFLAKHKSLVLDHVSLTVSDGECVALIGESGSGKSTLTRLILGLERPDGGRILWNGRIISGKAVRRQLYCDIQPVFQNSAVVLNPRWKTYDSICEPISNYLKLDKAAERKEILSLLEMVELPADILDKYPHELSGGQQKRVCIARAIAIRPRLILLDEAIAGIDATITRKILILLKGLQRELGCAYLFITHDIKAAFFMARKIAVMTGGEIVETVENAQFYSNFTHPYSLRLMKGKSYFIKPQEV